MTQPNPTTSRTPDAQVRDEGITWDVVEEAIATISRAFEEDAIQRPDHLQEMQDAVDDWRREIDMVKRSLDFE